MQKNEIDACSPFGFSFDANHPSTPLLLHPLVTRGQNGDDKSFTVPLGKSSLEICALMLLGILLSARN